MYIKWCTNTCAQDFRWLGCQTYLGIKVFSSIILIQHPLLPVNCIAEEWDPLFHSTFVEKGTTDCLSLFFFFSELLESIGSLYEIDEADRHRHSHRHSPIPFHMIKSLSFQFTKRNLCFLYWLKVTTFSQFFFIKSLARLCHCDTCLSSSTSSFPCGFKEDRADIQIFLSFAPKIMSFYEKIQNILMIGQYWIWVLLWDMFFLLWQKHYFGVHLKFFLSHLP